VVSHCPVAEGEEAIRVHWARAEEDQY
jgi:hypothetical protein